MSYKDNILSTKSGNPETLDFTDCLLTCVKTLKPKERIVFILRDMEEMSIKEAAQILNSSQAMVKYRLASARRNLKNKIIKHYPSLEEK